MTSLLGAIRKTAATRASSTALIDLGTGAEWTYANLVERSLLHASASSESPARRPIAIALNPQADVVAAMYGYPETRRPVVAANLRWNADDATRWLIQANVGAALLDVGSDLEARLPADIPRLPVDPPSSATHGNDDQPFVEPTGAEDAWWIYTSGTTGIPKLARLTHDSLLAAVAATQHGRPAEPTDVYLYPFPLFHVSAYNLLHHHILGATVVLCPNVEPRTIGRAVAEHQVTTISLAPTMIAKLLDCRIDLSGLRRISYGAAPMHPDLLRRAYDAWGCDFAQGYGMTELSGNAVFLNPDWHRRGLHDDPSILQAAGIPAPGVDVEVHDETGELCVPGASGEIWVRAEQVFAGYVGESTGPPSSEWLRTGDVGRWRSDGLLEIVDRSKDVIVTGGENVASRRVETSLLSAPGVAAAAAVAAADPYWGEVVCAILVAANPADAVAAEKQCASQLAGFERPRRWFLAEELPINAAGKVDKSRLREWVASAGPALRELDIPRSSALHATTTKEKTDAH